MGKQLLYSGFKSRDHIHLFKNKCDITISCLLSLSSNFFAPGMKWSRPENFSLSRQKWGISRETWLWFCTNLVVTCGTEYANWGYTIWPPAQGISWEQKNVIVFKIGEVLSDIFKQQFLTLCTRNLLLNSVLSTLKLHIPVSSRSTLIVTYIS